MKKIIVLVVALAILAGLGYYATTLMDKSGKSDLELIDFAVKDIESVDKIIITDKQDRSYTLLKKGKDWTSADGACVTRESVDWVLDAFKNIRFRGYLTDKSVDHFTKLMSAQHIKVEIFQNGEWTKTWYIGPSTQDHAGQIMLLDSKEEGKSSVPVEMKLNNMHGIIDPRFHADPFQWQCTDIFRLSMEKIKSVNVKFNDEPARSFKVTKNGQKIDVYQQGKLLPDVAPQDAYRYLNNYQKVHWLVANYVLDDKGVDSLKRTTPFCVLTLAETSGKSTQLKLYRIVSKGSEKAAAGTVVDPDLDHLWCLLPNGKLVKCQYFVFNPLIMGHVYFPMDMSTIKTVDGVRTRETETQIK